jgi:hypothetical protein
MTDVIIDGPVWGGPDAVAAHAVPVSLLIRSDNCWMDPAGYYRAYSTQQPACDLRWCWRRSPRREVLCRFVCRFGPVTGVFMTSSAGWGSGWVICGGSMLEQLVRFRRASPYRRFVERQCPVRPQQSPLQLRCSVSDSGVTAGRVHC